MLEHKLMSNGEIYECGKTIVTDFSDDISLPVKTGFYLRKNLKKMLSLATEIDEARADILSKYGTLNEDGTKFELRPESVNTAMSEIKELLSVTQIVDVYMLKLDDFGDISLTSSQVDAISFMIEEDE